MTYPEPIPELTEEEWEEFLKRWKKFKLTDEQKELYKGAKELYEKNPF